MANEAYGGFWYNETESTMVFCTLTLSGSGSSILVYPTLSKVEMGTNTKTQIYPLLEDALDLFVLPDIAVSRIERPVISFNSQTGVYNVAFLLFGSNGGVWMLDAELLQTSRDRAVLIGNPTLHLISTEEVAPTTPAPTTPPPTTTPAPVSPNYVELPLNHYYLYNPSAATVYIVSFRGVVRIYEAGAVQYIGEITTSSSTPIDYKIWIGSSPTVGSFVSVGTCGTNRTWVHVDTIIPYGAGNDFYLVFNDITGNVCLPDMVQALSYPNGWNSEFTISATSGGSVYACNITPTSASVGLSGNYSAGPNTAGSLQSYDQDTSSPTADGDQGGFTRSNSTTYFNQTGSISFTYTKTVPTSTTVGASIFLYSAIAGSNIQFGGGWIGPFMQTAPSIQVGTPPF